MLELEPLGFGSVKIEPELLELPDTPLLELLEPALLLESSALLEALLDDEPLVTEDAVVAAVWVSPHIPAKRPMVAAATPTRRLRRAAIRAAGGRRAPPAATACGCATRRPAVASVTSPCGCATQLST